MAKAVMLVLLDQFPSGTLVDSAGLVEDIGPNKIPEMRDRVGTAAEEVGRDPKEITLVYNIEVRIDSTANAEPYVVSGSPEGVADQLRSLLELGLGGMNLMPVGQNLDEQVERLGAEILPLLRDNTR